MRRLTDQEKKWREILGTSTNPQEIIEMAAKLKMAPVTMEEAMEIVEMHKDEEEGGALKMKRTNSGDPHLKIAGIIPATDEERLELMQTLLNFSAEESKELLDKMNARRKK